MWTKVELMVGRRDRERMSMSAADVPRFNFKFKILSNISKFFHKKDFVFQSLRHDILLRNSGRAIKFYGIALFPVVGKYFTGKRPLPYAHVSKVSLHL